MDNSLWAAMRQGYDNGLFNSFPMGGKNFYLDPLNGSDVSGTGSKTKPFATLATAYAACTAGKNDTVVLVGDGATTGTARVDAAFTWSKAATHLVGVASPSLYSQRARVANTSSTTAFANFFTVSADGCFFRNVSFLQDFATDTTDQITMTVSGNRNVFKNVHLFGIAKGDDTGGRCLKLTGQENLFEDSVIGQDTIDRSVANATVEFASGSARNAFRRVYFPFRATNSGVLGVIVAGAAGSDRFQLFEDCIFMNHNTTMTAISTLAASMGGFHAYVNCTLIKITGYGSDATSRNQIYVVGNIGTAGTSGIAVAPTA